MCLYKGTHSSSLLEQMAALKAHLNRFPWKPPHETQLFQTPGMWMPWWCFAIWCHKCKWWFATGLVLGEVRTAACRRWNLKQLICGFCSSPSFCLTFGQFGSCMTCMPDRQSRMAADAFCSTWRSRRGNLSITDKESRNAALLNCFPSTSKFCCFCGLFRSSTSHYHCTEVQREMVVRPCCGWAWVLKAV